MGVAIAFPADVLDAPLIPPNELDALRASLGWRADELLKIDILGCETRARIVTVDIWRDEMKLLQFCLCSTNVLSWIAAPEERVNIIPTHITVSPQDAAVIIDVIYVRDKRLYLRSGAGGKWSNELLMVPT